MRKNHVIARHKLSSCFLILAAILFFSSCAQDGFDDKEKFTCDVNNSQLESPSADSITIAASADGAYFTATWPVVFGAGGYQVSVYDVSDMENPIIKDSLIDGCSMRFNREEDMLKHRRKRLSLLSHLLIRQYQMVLIFMRIFRNIHCLQIL